jgi:hypothetical protein
MAKETEQYSDKRLVFWFPENLDYGLLYSLDIQDGEQDSSLLPKELYPTKVFVIDKPLWVSEYGSEIKMENRGPSGNTEVIVRFKGEKQLVNKAGRILQAHSSIMRLTPEKQEEVLEVSNILLRPWEESLTPKKLDRLDLQGILYITPSTVEHYIWWTIWGNEKKIHLNADSYLQDLQKPRKTIFDTSWKQVNAKKRNLERINQVIDKINDLTVELVYSQKSRDVLGF